MTTLLRENHYTHFDRHSSGLIFVDRVIYVAVHTEPYIKKLYRLLHIRYHMYIKTLHIFEHMYVYMHVL